MRILYLTFDDLTVPYAWSVHVRSTINGLAARGHEVRLVCPGGAAPGVLATTVRIPPGRWQHFFGSVRTFVSAGLDFNPEVIYVRGIHASTSPSGAAAELHRPLVVEVNGLLEHETRSAWRRALVRRAHRITLARAARVVAVSPLLGEALTADYGFPRDRIDVIPNGVDTERFRPADRLEARHRLGLPPDRPVVVCVASFYGHHGRELLESAAREAGVLLVLVGAEGASGPDLRCEGRVNHELVPDYLAAADLCAYVLKAPHPRFGFSPLKLYEYMAAGRAVVAATDQDEIRSFIQSRGVGEAVGLDSAELATVMRRLVQNPSRREALGRAGREAALSDFTWERSVERVEASLQRALSSALP